MNLWRILIVQPGNCLSWRVELTGRILSYQKGKWLHWNRKIPPHFFKLYSRSLLPMLRVCMCMSACVYVHMYLSIYGYISVIYIWLCSLNLTAQKTRKSDNIWSVPVVKSVTMVSQMNWAERFPSALLEVGQW